MTNVQNFIAELEVYHNRTPKPEEAVLMARLHFKVIRDMWLAKNGFEGINSDQKDLMLKHNLDKPVFRTEERVIITGYDIHAIVEALNEVHSNLVKVELSLETMIENGLIPKEKAENPVSFKDRLIDN
jgi:hypothetical protein